MQTPPLRDVALAQLAAEQHGVVTVAQLAALGFAASSIRRRVLNGTLHRVGRGVYAVGQPRLSWAGRKLAAVLATGPDAVLSHISAAQVWHLLEDRGGELHVTVARAIHRAAGTGRRGSQVHVHCVRSLHAHDVARRDSLPLTTVTRTLLDLADDAADRDDERLLRRALRQAELLELVQEHQLHEQLARAHGRGGAPRLAALIADGPTPTRSELEDRLLALVRAHRLGDPHVNARVGVPGGTFEVDLLYAQERLIVEADGARYHSGRFARRTDAERQARLEAAGYRFVRVTWDEVTRRAEETVARLRVALRDQRAALRAEALAVTARGRPAGAAGGGSSLVTNEGGAIAR